MYSVDIPRVIIWLQTIFEKETKYQMKQENGYPYVNQSFFGHSRTVRLCVKCDKEYLEGALDFMEQNIVCPICANGKDEE